MKSGCAIAGVEGLNPAEGVDVRLVLLRVFFLSSGLCERLIRADGACLIVRELGASTKRLPRSKLKRKVKKFRTCGKNVRKRNSGKRV